jgi:GAF domain-containing protein
MPPNLVRADRNGASGGPLMALGRTRQQLSALAALITQRPRLFAAPTMLPRHIVEAASSMVQVGRVSLWQLAGSADKLECTHVRGAVGVERTMLAAHDHPRYFEALLAEPLIAAVDVKRDARTSSRSLYYASAGIGAALDVPVWAQARFVGVLSHEHLGGPRAWDPDDHRGALLMAGLLSFCMEATR